jgi:pyruvate/2-oxoglutarate dehydrogenase complex dihydrolipoamide dehydrogenase (E3) component
VGAVAGLDLIVIGAGMAGMNAAARASEAGARVAVIERDRVGGTCPLRGCIPSKALIRSAEVAHEVRGAAAYGVRVEGFSVDMPAVIDRVQAIIEKGGDGARSYLESLPGVSVVMGEARFRRQGELEVDGRVLRAPRVVIATGAAPALVPIPGLAETPHLTSTDVLSLRELPERLLVIGAGPVGLELGQALSRLGSRVTIVEVAPRLLPSDEPEIAEALSECLAGEGIELLVDATIERVATGPGGRPRMVVTHDGATRELEGDAVLLGAGRDAQVESLRLEEAGVEGGRKGIPVDRRLQTSGEGHFAAGDVLPAEYGPYTHTARRLGASAAANALGDDPQDVAPDFGPRAIFTDPEVVTIGMTEEQAREAGGRIGAGTSAFSGGKARAWGQERGLAKAVVDRAGRRILGAHVVAYHAADLIHPVAVAMQAGGADPLLGAFHVHPTLGERVQEAVGNALSAG